MSQGRSEESVVRDEAASVACLRFAALFARGRSSVSAAGSGDNLRRRGRSPPTVSMVLPRALMNGWIYHMRHVAIVKITARPSESRPGSLSHTRGTNVWGGRRGRHRRVLFGEVCTSSKICTVQWDPRDTWSLRKKRRVTRVGTQIAQSPAVHPYLRGIKYLLLWYLPAPLLPTAASLPILIPHLRLLPLPCRTKSQDSSYQSFQMQLY